VLLDSNIIIFRRPTEYATLRQFIGSNVPYVSAITYVEVLGYHLLAHLERELLVEFFNSAPILPITTPIMEAAVNLRQQRRVSLGDSLIAATALVHDQTLVTHNLDDFRWIQGLQLLDSARVNPLIVYTWDD